MVHGSRRLIRLRGIEIRSLPAHRDMEMRAGGAAGAAAQADYLAPLYLIAFFHFELRKMQVERSNPWP